VNVEMLAQKHFDFGLIQKQLSRPELDRQGTSKYRGHYLFFSVMANWKFKCEIEVVRFINI